MTDNSVGFAPLASGAKVTESQQERDKLWAALTRPPALTLRQFKCGRYLYELRQRGQRCTHYVTKNGVEMTPSINVLRAWVSAAGRTTREPLAIVTA